MPHVFILSMCYLVSLVSLFLSQYFEGDDLPEATATDIDLLLDQPDQFHRGVGFCSKTSITVCDKQCIYIFVFKLFSLMSICSSAEISKIQEESVSAYYCHNMFLP